MPLKEGLLAEYDREIATTRKLLERIPDGKMSWKPHEKSMSLGSLATHLANLLTWLDTILNAFSFDLATLPSNLEAKSSRADVLDAFDRAAAKARPWLDKTDAELNARWTLNRGDQELFSLPRIAALRAFVLSHIIHHRGQLSVYLRLNDVPVPAIYGPSADEG